MTISQLCLTIKRCRARVLRGAMLILVGVAVSLAASGCGEPVATDSSTTSTTNPLFATDEFRIKVAVYQEMIPSEVSVQGLHGDELVCFLEGSEDEVGEYQRQMPDLIIRSIDRVLRDANGDFRPDGVEDRVTGEQGVRLRVTVGEIQGTEATATFDYFLGGAYAAVYTVDLKKEAGEWSVVDKKMLWVK